MRLPLRSAGCFLWASIVVRNFIIQLYTLIRIYLYLSWAERVGPLWYSLIRSYWLGQTGQFVLNRSVHPYYSKQLLPSWTATAAVRCCINSDKMMGYLPYQPLCVWGILCFCMYVWLTKHDDVIVFITSDRFRFTLDTLDPRHESAAVWDSSMNQRVTGTLCILFHNPMAGNIILIIDCISLLLVSLGWDNGSIERASKRWCVFLCTCMKSITHSNRRIATYGMALYSWLKRMYVRNITDQSCLYMCIEFLLYEQGGA